MKRHPFAASLIGSMAMSALYAAPAEVKTQREAADLPPPEPAPPESRQVRRARERALAKRRA